MFPAVYVFPCVSLLPSGRCSRHAYHNPGTGEVCVCVCLYTCVHAEPKSKGTAGRLQLPNTQGPAKDSVGSGSWSLNTWIPHPEP